MTRLEFVLSHAKKSDKDQTEIFWLKMHQNVPSWEAQKKLKFFETIIMTKVWYYFGSFISTRTNQNCFELNVYFRFWKHTWNFLSWVNNWMNSCFQHVWRFRNDFLPQILFVLLLENIFSLDSFCGWTENGKKDVRLAFIYFGNGLKMTQI